MSYYIPHCVFFSLVISHQDSLSMRKSMPGSSFSCGGKWGMKRSAPSLAPLRLASISGAEAATGVPRMDVRAALG